MESVSIVLHGLIKLFRYQCVKWIHYHFITFFYTIFSYVQSWIDKRDTSLEKAVLSILFEKYVPTLIEVNKNRFKKITPISEINHLQLVCQLLDCLLTTENCPTDSPKEWFETYFVFAAVWGFGSATYQDQVQL